MKNKHLVILFLAALGAGLLTRSFPWRTDGLFQTNLLRINPTEITRFSVLTPDNPELLLEKTENGWVVSQRNRTLRAPAALVGQFLETCVTLQSIRVVKTSEMEASGLNSADTIGLRIYSGDHLAEFFRIGRVVPDTQGQFASYLRVGAHAGDYLVRGDIRQVFDKTIDDFRKNTVLDFPLDSVQTLALNFPRRAPFYLEKRDSSGQWIFKGGVFQADSIQKWLNLLNRLNESRFADHYDDTRNAQTRVLNLALYGGKRQVLLEFFHVPRPDLPDDPASFPARQPLLATWFVRSSQNPANYFAVLDSTLARRICNDLCKPLANADSTSAQQ